MKRISFCLAVMCVLQQAMAQDTVVKGNRYPRPVTFTAQEDHDNMMRQLGITELRPGPSGDANAPNHANYDEAKANLCPVLPDALTLEDGKKVTTAGMWWTGRRPEIVAGLEREVYGREPAHTPGVTWTVKVTDHELVGFIPVVAKELVGHVDNSDYPLIQGIFLIITLTVLVASIVADVVYVLVDPRAREGAGQ